MSEQIPSSNTTYSLPNSSMAIVSLVAGILGLTFFPLLGSIVALVTGSMAKKEILNSQGSLGGEGMARAGTILGWIGVALSLIGCCVFAIAFLVPSLLILLGLSSDSSGMIIQTLLMI